MFEANKTGQKRRSRRVQAVLSKTKPLTATFRQSVHQQLGPYRIEYRERRTLGISVEPNGSLWVAAPVSATLEEIEALLTKRRRWIRSQRRYFAELNTTSPPKRYVSGATHRYLGRQYRLKVVDSTKTSVRLLGGYFLIESPKTSPGEIERHLGEWYREHALRLFRERVAEWEKWCARQGLPKPTAHLRNMPKRWASAHKDGNIYFNPILIRAPSACIDYAIAHEICHLKHHSHGRAFYSLLSRLYPAWKSAKLRLECCEL